MSSLLWLALYLLPLLGLTAVVFAWLGWRWGATPVPAPTQEGEQAAASASEVVVEKQDTDEVEAQQAALRESLEKAQTELRTWRDEATTAREYRQVLEDGERRLRSEMETLRGELTTLRNDYQQTQAALQSANAEITSLRAQPIATEVKSVPETTQTVQAPEKIERPKPKRQSTKKVGGARVSSDATLQERIAALLHQLEEKAAILGPLAQEHDDWQRRVTTLEAKVPVDRAGLALARRSLAESAERLSEVREENERVREQVQVLQRVETAAAQMVGVPDDDLTRIKGIKKLTSDRLRAYGVRTWRQIAQWDEQEMAVFSALLAFKNRAVREQWQAQARALHEATHGSLS